MPSYQTQSDTLSAKVSMTNIDIACLAPPKTQPQDQLAAVPTSRYMLKALSQKTPKHIGVTAPHKYTCYSLSQTSNSQHAPEVDKHMCK